MGFLQRTRRQPDFSAPGTITTFADFRTEMDRLFDRFMQDPWMNSETFQPLRAWTPALDIAETENDIAIRVELPGVDRDQIDVSITDGGLTISGKKQEAMEEKGKDFFHCERRFGSFRRFIDLPEKVDASKVVAEFHNGILTVTVPKPETVKPKHVEVKPVGESKQPKRVPVGAA